jgi:hypothetical protein
VQARSPCFPPWSSKNEEKKYAKLSTIRAGDCCYANSNDTYGSEYQYLTADKTNFTTYGHMPLSRASSPNILSVRYTRGLNRYHGGGYLVRLQDPSTAGATLQRLQDNRWIDMKTRAILTAFCVFNLNNQLFLCMHITVEVDNLGKYTLDQRYFPVNLDSYDMVRNVFCLWGGGGG